MVAGDVWRQVVHFEGIQCKWVEQELPKAEASKFIVTVDNRGRVSEDLTLQRVVTPEVCGIEGFGNPEERSPKANCGR
jgi:hypothetical protein